LPEVLSLCYKLQTAVERNTPDADLRASLKTGSFIFLLHWHYLKLISLFNIASKSLIGKSAYWLVME